MDIPIVERMLSALLVQLVRTEGIDPDDIVEAAERLERAGDEDAAHALRCIVVEAAAPEPSDWAAEKRRNRFHVIDGASGNSDD